MLGQPAHHSLISPRFSREFKSMSNSPSSVNHDRAHQGKEGTPDTHILNTPLMEQAVTQFLSSIGVNLEDPNFHNTPERVTQAWREEFLRGYQMKPHEILSATYPCEDSGPVVVTNLRFVSVCPHHLLPYTGAAHLAYLPASKVVGLGKLSDLVDCFARRMVLQETLTRQIPKALMNHLQCQGAACILVTHQSCLALRGARQDQNRCTTAAYFGAFQRDESLQTLLFKAVPTGGSGQI